MWLDLNPVLKSTKVYKYFVYPILQARHKLPYVQYSGTFQMWESLLWPILSGSNFHEKKFLRLDSNLVLKQAQITRGSVFRHISVLGMSPLADIIRKYLFRTVHVVRFEPCSHSRNAYGLTTLPRVHNLNFIRDRTIIHSCIKKKMNLFHVVIESHYGWYTIGY